MDTKLYLAAGWFSALVATIGSVAQDFWPLLLGLAGTLVTAYWTWLSKAQDYRHKEEIHDIEVQERRWKIRNPLSAILTATPKDQPPPDGAK